MPHRNVEIKARYGDPGRIREILTQRGASAPNTSGSSVSNPRTC